MRSMRWRAVLCRQGTDASGQASRSTGALDLASSSSMVKDLLISVTLPPKCVCCCLLILSSSRAGSKRLWPASAQSSPMSRAKIEREMTPMVGQIISRLTTSGAPAGISYQRDSFLIGIITHCVRTDEASIAHVAGIVKAPSSRRRSGTGVRPSPRRGTVLAAYSHPSSSLEN